MQGGWLRTMFGAFWQFRFEHVYGYELGKETAVPPVRVIDPSPNGAAVESAVRVSVPPESTQVQYWPLESVVSNVSTEAPCDGLTYAPATGLPDLSTTRPVTHVACPETMAASMLW